MNFADPHIVPDRIPVGIGEGIQQTQQPVPQPRPCCRCHSDAALPASALRTRGTPGYLQNYLGYLGRIFKG